MITIIGLGNERGDLTLSALKILKDAERVFVKKGGRAFDELKEQGVAFEEGKFSESNLLKEAQNKVVCYCVSGSAFDDKTARALMREQNVKTIDCCCYKSIADEELVKKERFCFQDFVYVLKRLRAKDGCPWDRAQTHASIRINMIEEAYELVDAIDSDDKEKILEETGDVLMQAVFHALIEEERGRFDTGDMVSAVCKKLISRHTHVFGGDGAQGADGALFVWDKNKMKEKKQEKFSDAVNDVPEGFPALLRAQKIAKRMAKGGWKFDPPTDSEAAMVKAVDEGDKETIAEVLGEILMGFAHLAHFTGIDAEQTLLDACKKIARQYAEWERLVLADGKNVLELSDQERLEYWKKAKENVS